MIKITKDSKLMIWGSTPEVRSGGAEVLNKLAAYLKSLGVNAKMFNYGMAMYEQGEYYKDLYDVDCASWKEVTDEETTIILIPEIMIENPDNLEFFCNFKHAQLIIWWLSSGFDYGDKTKKTSHRRIMLRLKSIEHRLLNLCENEMISRDLMYFGLNSKMKLQHDIYPLFYTSPKTCEKENVVMYNGCKKVTRAFVEEKLMPRLPDVKFISPPYNIQKFYGKDKMIELYDKAKVYVDFYEFEGREMCPREAAVRDCILLLNNEGNASTFEDYPIPEWYKIRKYSEEDIDDICSKIRTCLDEYDQRIGEFSFFKRKCMFEPKQFRLSVQMIFGDMIPDENKMRYDD